MSFGAKSVKNQEILNKRLGKAASLFLLITGCPRIFRNKNKTFIRLCNPVHRKKKKTPLTIRKFQYDIGLDKLEGPANVETKSDLIIQSLERNFKFVKSFIIS